MTVEQMHLPTAARRLGPHVRRFRYLRKARMVWGRRASLCPSSPAVALRYVLWHPELDTFSIRLANRDEVLARVAAALEVLPDGLGCFADELLFDDEVAASLPRHMVRRRPADPDRDENLLGRQVPKYVAARAMKPRLIVETGVKDGYGSAALLRALERNGAEGFPGELLSFDLNPTAGRAVPEDLRDAWEFVPCSSIDMGASLMGRQVDLLVSDSSPDYACVASEVQTVLAAGAAGIVVMGNADWNSAIRDAEHGDYAKSLHSCRLIPDDTLYRSQTLDIAVFRRTGPAG